MKGKLEFTLPTEQSEFEIASKAQDIYFDIIELDNYLRNKIKHGHTYIDPDEVLEEMRQYTIAILNRVKE